MGKRGGYVTYDLTQPKKTLACILQSSDRHDLSGPKVLDTLINEMKIKKITLYDDIPTVGACPAALKGKQGYDFVPTSDDHRKMIKDGAALAQAKFIWAFKYTAKEAMLSVYGIVLCTAKQTIVTANERTALS